MSNIATPSEIDSSTTEKTAAQKESFFSRFTSGIVLNIIGFVLVYHRRLVIGAALALIASAGYVMVNRLTIPVKVQINNEGVAEKGWFSNLMWRKDSSKVINVEVQPGFDKTGVSVTAVRGNGEKTVMNSEGVWHLFE